MNITHSITTAVLAATISFSAIADQSRNADDAGSAGWDADDAVVSGRMGRRPARRDADDGGQQGGGMPMMQMMQEWHADAGAYDENGNSYII